MLEKIKVLIVDDSGLTQEILKKILEKDLSIQVIGMAENGEKEYWTWRARPSTILGL